MKKCKRIALLTGGGDCPGLNAAIRAVTKTAMQSGIEVLGVQRGFFGFEDDHVFKLTSLHVSGLLSRGGTILRSSRFNPFKSKKTIKKLKEQIQNYKIDGLVVIGGDGSLGIAKDCHQKLHIPTMGIPKTIDNDVYGTDYTIGFNTAVQTAVDAIDRLHTTAESHEFIMVVELMGRHCGYLANYAGLAAGADLILVPEVKATLKNITSVLKKRRELEKNSSIVVVAEDAKIYDGKKLAIQTQTIRDEYGKIKLGGVGWLLKDVLQDQLNCEVRCTVLGHVQRGGTPVAFDRLMATKMGVETIRQIKAGKWGKLVAYEKGQVVAKRISVVRDGTKRLPKALNDEAHIFSCA